MRTLGRIEQAAAALFMVRYTTTAHRSVTNMPTIFSSLIYLKIETQNKLNDMA